MNVEPMKFPGVSWQLNVSDHTEVFSQEAVAQAKRILQDWVGLYPLGNTWVGNQFRVPSLIVRLDCVVEEGVLRLYEVEDRPCGIGATLHMVPEFRHNLGKLRGEWPDFNWVMSPNRQTDDVLWLGEGLALEQAKRCDGLLLVRSRPEDAEFHELEPRAVSTVQHEGNKLVCVEPPLNFYTVINWVSDPGEQSGGYIENLPPGPIVVKPCKGTRAREVRVYLNGSDPQGLRIHRRDKMSFGDLERWMKQQRKAVCQPFIPAMRLGCLPNHNTIYRMFFGFSPTTGEYEPLGGVWMANEEMIVHGRDNAISGPLVLG